MFPVPLDKLLKNTLMLMFFICKDGDSVSIPGVLGGLNEAERCHTWHV